jgi:hypothetical protein
MKVVYIYGLYSSNDDTIRYVGKCINPVHRLNMHYSQRNSKKSHKNNWIKKVIREGNEIHMKILEEVSEENWQEKEKNWIKTYKNLTNISEGGLGGSVKKYNISYEDAKKYISHLSISSKSDYIRKCKEEYFPNNIPKNPVQYFKSDWISWGDYLGTNREQDNKLIEKYLEYDDAKKWVHSNLKVKSISKWKELVNNNKIPDFIPNRPNRFYKNRGWENWTIFLNNKRISNNKRNIIKHDEAKILMAKLNISTLKEYKKLQSERYINELPVHPHLTYKNKGFKNYDDFFNRF